MVFIAMDLKNTGQKSGSQTALSALIFIKKLKYIPWIISNNKQKTRMTNSEISPNDTSNTCDCCMRGWNNPNEDGLCTCVCGLCSEQYRLCRGQCNEPDIVINNDSDGEEDEDEEDEDEEDEDDRDNYCNSCAAFWNECNCWWTRYHEELKNRQNRQ